VTTPRVTLLDVAQRAGVSRTTASFVMTGRRDMRISSDAEQRVRQAARELNYRPSLLARSLRTNLSQTIGLISDVIATEVFAGEVIRGSMATALLHDHLMFIGETEGDPEVEKRLVQSMLDRGVGGFVYASMYTRNVRVSKTLRDQPLVLLNSMARGKPLPSVIPDELEAGKSAVRELLRHGHRDQIVVVGERAPHVIAAAERLAGVEEVLRQQGTQLAGSIDALWWPEYAHQAVRAYLQEGHRPSAFVCLNDRLAFGTYQAAQDLGLSVPQDFSVVSFDDSDLAGWLRPTLTSVAIPHFEMGRRAVELLLTPDRPTGVQRVPMPLRTRESVGPPPVRRRRRTGR
jgi:LacI family transcriptional regulator